MQASYLETVEKTYRDAAVKPDAGLCCTTTPVWQLPGLKVPSKMLAMNYGCGSTVHPRDLTNSPTVLYAGVGGGMELLQFAYFSRKPGGIIGVDAVQDMLNACGENLLEAEACNPWFKREYIDLRKGDALCLPVGDESVDVAAQNCLFNVFHRKDLIKALSEMFRILKPGGRLVLSDPVAEGEMPENLKNDAGLRAICLSGALSLKEYIGLITDTGFGTVEIRARRPYRVIDPRHFATGRTIFLESVEVCAIKDPIPADGPCVFTGKTIIYFGKDDYFDDGKGHLMKYNQPLSVCDKTAGSIRALGRDDIFVSESTWFYDGGGCC